MMCAEARALSDGIEVLKLYQALCKGVQEA